MIIEEISRLVGEKKLEQRRRGKDRGSDELQKGESSLCGRTINKTGFLTLSQGSRSTQHTLYSFLGHL